MDKLYAQRDIEAQGEAYVKHVSAMTGEKLHSKSAIAAELAHRDLEIERLRAELDKQKPCAETLGWTWAMACALLDRDIDPRTVEVPDVLALAKEELTKGPDDE